MTSWAFTNAASCVATMRMNPSAKISSGLTEGGGKRGREREREGEGGRGRKSYIWQPRDRA